MLSNVQIRHVVGKIFKKRIRKIPCLLETSEYLVAISKTLELADQKEIQKVLMKLPNCSCSIIDGPHELLSSACPFYVYKIYLSSVSFELRKKTLILPPTALNAQHLSNKFNKLLWRPGIGVGVTQRHCVFKPIT